MSNSLYNIMVREEVTNVLLFRTHFRSRGPTITDLHYRD
jgi:hypothetical protein